MSRIPEYSTRMAGPEGKITPEWAKYFRKIEQDVATNAAALAGTGSADSGDDDEAVGLASKEQTFAEAAYIEVVEDKDYPFISLGYTGEITSVVTEAQSGSCTVEILIGATALGGGTNAASTTRSTVTHSASNTLAAGDDVTIRISSNSSCEGLSVTIKGTQTLA